MTKCKGPHYDFDDFTSYDFTTFMTSRLLIDLETHCCTVNPISRSITSREVVKVVSEVVSREAIQVVVWSFGLCHIKTFLPIVTNRDGFPDPRHGLGGSVAAALASRNPALVGAVCLVDSAPTVPVDSWRFHPLQAAVFEDRKQAVESLCAHGCWGHRCASRTCHAGN